VFDVAASADGTITLAQVTGGPPPSTLDHWYRDQLFYRLDTFALIKASAYNGTTKILTHSYPGGDIGSGYSVVVCHDQCGGAADNATLDWGDMGATLGGMLRNMWENRVGAMDEAAGEAGAVGLFGRVRQLEDDIAALSAGQGVQRGEFTAYPYTHPTALGSSDPTVSEHDAGSTTQNTAYRILDKATIALPEGSDGTVDDITYRLEWACQITDGGGGGNGDSVFYISPDSETETEGSAPSVSAVQLTVAQAETTSKTFRAISALCSDAQVPGAGGFHLLLCAKVDDAQDTATGYIRSSTYARVGYHV
jgi:hypothetical protein